MASGIEKRCADLLVELGLIKEGQSCTATPLTGGVASDIAMVEFEGRKVCAKFALAKLKVAEDWFAPVHRNRAEYEWLRVASAIAPDGAVKLFGRSDTLNGFTMEFLEGSDVYLWKDALLAGHAPQGEATVVGDLIGRIHAASTQAGFDAAPFHNADDFRALRIEPYLTFTAGRHPDCRDNLHALADMLYSADRVLVHGDVSPKNILLRGGRPVVLDAECATLGDASFDPSFCLNHLVLKSIHLPRMAKAYLQEAVAFWNSYRAHVTWEDDAALEQRICRLLPALMLGRIDGKSPVEYLNTASQSLTRDLARSLIMAPPATLAEVFTTIHKTIRDAQS
ncbi:aminoglycoside phosphotransferase family protein [Sulfitobacter mediterraneus]|uniref:phosphotransferase family protein n=1 Tax=Sulfitobacter mediterraneus TaxID=83219 RepID=UPI0019340B5F|nr:aminoglycoside phosphotransferase family protein [Sulfitobacter mediterraneus]MBM1634541.1 aminoglycoside phosphotransferase family protein [Sulfitobacter mediterraneus]MBM1642359.1 aminoglycoside phosphotransferase family protein [Sulfitobacter mediterraneus]MBM1646407.1 aminoglycoside phosphotransferase family protein [Sulfitobacter mediterraneus]MBM1650453.1 aminoglycoside phosphotransferase family protein [Sulfitobacter mediterraneus]MBM1654475.1 aminoglycoside phosphotransferase family